MSPPENPREVCNACFRPGSLCVCALLPRIAHRTQVVVLQHPKEHRHPFNSVRFARVALERLRIEVCEPDGRSRWSAAEAPGRWLVLDASADRALPASAAPPAGIVALDGTWPQAKVLRRANPWLDSLESFRIDPPVPSRYQMRGEPAPHCVSTLEAIVYALQSVEPDLTGSELLLCAFTELNARQVQRAREALKPRARRKIPSSPPSLEHHLIPASGPHAGTSLGAAHVRPPSLDRAVFLHVEHVSDAARGEYELVGLFAQRGESGDSFQCIVRPERLKLSEARLEHIGLPPSAIESGVSQVQATAALAAFLRVDDVVVTWKQSTLNVLRRTIGFRDATVPEGGRAAQGRSEGGASMPAEGRDAMVLEDVYAAARGRHCGGLTEACVREGVVPVEVAFPGRAARVLGELLAIASKLGAGTV